MLSHHFISTIEYSKLSYPLILLLFLLAVMTVVFIVQHALIKFNRYKIMNNIDFSDSEIPDYFKALKQIDREEFVEEEIAYRKLGFKYLDDQSFEELKRLIKEEDDLKAKGNNRNVGGQMVGKLASY